VKADYAPVPAGDRRAPLPCALTPPAPSFVSRQAPIALLFVPPLRALFRLRSILPRAVNISSTCFESCRKSGQRFKLLMALDGKFNHYDRVLCFLPWAVPFAKTPRR
jgi:hypothetical protein